MKRNSDFDHARPKDEKEEEDDDDIFQLPGFRFHPTDEELVGFYLQRKVEKKPIRIELIKQVDIYKFDPWDLPKPSNLENESYFFCKRGRKYRNSIRPNRVTGSGFWKATGIDKPIYSDKPENSDNVIGLKKTLVYYRGSAGKGTKTDWMMHEFRLPGNENYINNNNNTSPKSTSLEAEVWTLCRIFKRNISSRKYTPDWREMASNKRIKCHPALGTSCSFDSYTNQEAYISFGAPNNNIIHYNDDDRKGMVNRNVNERNIVHVNQLTSIAQQPPPPMAVLPASNSLCIADIPEATDQLFAYTNWDELRSVVEFALDPSPF